MDRTPKTGVLRRWILMPERKKLLIVAVISILGFFAFEQLILSSPEPTYVVDHVLTAGTGFALPSPVVFRHQLANMLYTAPVFVSGYCAAEEREAIRQQAIREQTAIHEAELQRLQEEGSRVQQLLEYVMAARGCVAIRAWLVVAMGACFVCQGAACQGNDQRNPEQGSHFRIECST
jgi:hypothetical protein